MGTLMCQQEKEAVSHFVLRCLHVYISTRRNYFFSKVEHLLVIHCKATRINWVIFHYCDVIMGTMASQITTITIIYSTVYSDADQRKHQRSASLAFVWGIYNVKSTMYTRVYKRLLQFHRNCLQKSRIIIKLSFMIFDTLGRHWGLTIYLHIMYTCISNWYDNAKVWGILIHGSVCPLYMYGRKYYIFDVAFKIDLFKSYPASLICICFVFG